MQKKLLALVVFLLFNCFTTPALAQREANILVPESTQSEVSNIEVKQLDKQAQILSAYLAKHNSPLQYHAQDFIDAAKQYDLDWRLVASIAGVESTFGKHIPGGYNGWGWGVYGTQAIYFNSWTDGIFTVSKGLRENYVNKGYTEPFSMNRIYAASPTWGSKVTFFMNQIEKFSAGFESENPGLIDSSSAQIAAVSASLVLR